MSAYIVEDKTINRVVYFLSCCVSPSSQLRRLLLDVAKLECIDGDKQLAGEMFMLNCKAVDLRYPGHAKSMPDAFRPLDFNYRAEMAERIQVFKSLRCWLYQCSEGEEIEGTELYKALDKVSDHLAYMLLTETAEYEGAEWG